MLCNSAELTRATLTRPSRPESVFTNTAFYPSALLSKGNKKNRKKERRDKKIDKEGKEKQEREREGRVQDYGCSLGGYRQFYRYICHLSFYFKNFRPSLSPIIALTPLPKAITTHYDDPNTAPSCLTNIPLRLTLIRPPTDGMGCRARSIAI